MDGTPWMVRGYTLTLETNKKGIDVCLIAIFLLVTLKKCLD